MTQNPVFSWIPAGVYPYLIQQDVRTVLDAIHVAVYKVIPHFKTFQWRKIW